MTVTCGQCRCQNLSQAAYCARCGQPLAVSQTGAASQPTQTTMTSSAPRRPGARRWIGWLVASIVFATIIFGVTGNFRDAKQRFVLRSDLAESLYSLLSPHDVSVTVARTPDGVEITGDHDEVETIIQFFHMLTQDDEWLAPEPLAPGMMHISYEARVYQLTRPKATAMHNTLNHASAPALAVRSGGQLTISCTPKAHAAIEDVVRLLGGKRLPPDLAQQEQRRQCTH